MGVNTIRIINLMFSCDCIRPCFTVLQGAKHLLNDNAQAMLDDTPEFDYLTHIVFRWEGERD